MISPNLVQSSRTQNFLDDGENDGSTDEESIYLSILSTFSSKGVHSKTMRPGYTCLVGEDDIGIENTASYSHLPDSGTLNFCSSQMAVWSLSGFIHNHVDQL